MTMTRKDFEAIALVMRNARVRHSDPPGWHSTVDQLALVLARTNPRFDHERFVRACEGRPDAVEPTTAAEPYDPSLALRSVQF